MGKLIVILAESALELIPNTIIGHPSIINYARRKGKRVDEILLDRGYHHFAMKHLPEAEKRGRPDIVHLTLLNILNSPLNKRGFLESYIHTREDKVITINSEIRLPRNYDRFLGLIEQLYKFKKVPPTSKSLLTLDESTLADLVKELDISKVVGLSTKGSVKPLKELGDEISKLSSVAVLIGGFPKGHFNKENRGLIDELVKIYKESLDAWVIACRLIYQFELSSEIFF